MKTSLIALIIPFLFPAFASASEKIISICHSSKYTLEAYSNPDNRYYPILLKLRRNNESSYFASGNLSNYSPRVQALEEQVFMTYSLEKGRSIVGLSVETVSNGEDFETTPSDVGDIAVNFMLNGVQSTELFDLQKCGDFLPQ